MRRQVRGRDLGYEDRGRGEAVVFLHAFPFARDIWHGLGADGDVTAALAARFRVLSVDARGFGESDLRDRAKASEAGPSAPYALTDLADDLAALLDALAVERAAVVGMSMGGYTALAFAARHPARLAALVLADTRAAADTPEVRAKRDEALATIQGRGPDAYLDGSLARLLSPRAAPPLLAHVRARAEPRAESLVAGVKALRDRPDRSAELAAIACPALVVCGADDRVTPAAEMRSMTAAIGNGGRAAARRARYVELAGAGHLCHLEAPQAFATAVGAFLADALGGLGRSLGGGSAS
ncbi:MAG TPA: alpha/beta hydrolase [Polyangia bacterium]|jgi:pimeloyl-ACP methyl ester carboxylesterase